MKGKIVRTVGCSFKQMYGKSAYRKDIKKMISNILIDGNWFNMWFYADADEKMHVVVGAVALYESGCGWYVVKPFEKEFATREEGNAYYTAVMKTKRISKKGNEYYTLPNC